MHRAGRLIIACVLLGSVAFGCAQQVKTVRSERTVRAPAASGAQTEERVVAERETVTTATPPRHEPHGVLSTTVHLIGEVLALPFRLVGGLLRLIF